MYNQIAANKRKTWVLIILFSVVIVGLGWLFGVQTGDASSGIVLATIIATTMSLFSYFGGDKLALATSGAKEVSKEQAPELWRIVENLSITNGMPMPRVYVIQDAAPNAFATGRNPKHASIAVTTGLLQTMERNELEGVLAHELSHVKNYDILVMTIVIVLVGVVTLLADWLLRSSIFGNRGNDREHNQATVVLFVIGLVLSILSPLFAELIKLAVSRQREYLADASGALLTRYPEGLASALEKIASYGGKMKKANHATAHLFIANPFGASVKSLFSTHPPVEKRIQRLRSMGV
ncbi:MAG: zinc metalloprotease HtpX [Patescibacteria group bacterium]